MVAAGVPRRGTGEAGAGAQAEWDALGEGGGGGGSDVGAEVGVLGGEIGGGGVGVGGGGGGGWSGGGGVAEKMLREGAPAGPGPMTPLAGAKPGPMSSPTLPSVDSAQQQQLWAALQADRARLERELAAARKQAAAAAATANAATAAAAASSANANAASAAVNTAATASVLPLPGVPLAMVGRRILNPSVTSVESAWFQRLKLKHDRPLSGFGFNFNFRRYTMAAPPLRWRSVEEVEAEGAASLAEEDSAGTLRLPYKFLFARSDDLQIGDVAALLHHYKVRRAHMHTLTTRPLCTCDIPAHVHTLTRCP